MCPVVTFSSKKLSNEKAITLFSYQERRGITFLPGGGFLVSFGDSLHFNLLPSIILISRFDKTELSALSTCTIQSRQTLKKLR